MMLLLSYSTDCYSNTLIDVDTNVPIKSIVFIFRYFLFQNSVVFVGESAISFCRGLKVTLLRYFLGINQTLIRGSPKNEFAVKG